MLFLCVGLFRSIFFSHPPFKCKNLITLRIFSLSHNELVMFTSKGHLLKVNDPRPEALFSEPTPAKTVIHVKLTDCPAIIPVNGQNFARTPHQCRLPVFVGAKCRPRLSGPPYFVRCRPELGLTLEHFLHILAGSSVK